MHTLPHTHTHENANIHRSYTSIVHAYAHIHIYVLPDTHACTHAHRAPCTHARMHRNDAHPGEKGVFQQEDLGHEGVRVESQESRGQSDRLWWTGQPAQTLERVMWTTWPAVAASPHPGTHMVKPWVPAPLSTALRFHPSLSLPANRTAALPGEKRGPSPAASPR